MKHVLDWLRSLWPFATGEVFPERRRRTRWLTLKNAARAAIALIAAFLLLSIWSEFRPAHSGNPLLQGRAAPEAQAVAREPFEVVREGSPRSYPVAGAIGNDASAPVRPTPERQRIEPRESQLGKGKRIVISGGSEGVQVHVEPPPPVKPPPPQ